MTTRVTDAQVRVNNEVWAIVPNTLVFTEGDGEQKYDAASLGGGEIEEVYSHDVSTNFSMVKFEIYATIKGINDSKVAKTNRAANVVQIAGTTPEGRITRTFSRAAMLNDPEKGLGAETTIPIEFKSRKAI